MHSGKEEHLYEPIKKALASVFIHFLELKDDYYLENTSSGMFSDKLKGALDDSALHIIRVERFSPDLTGFIRKDNSIRIITVEVKREIKIKHIYKAKLYAEILDATYGLLISPKPIPEDIRRFIKHRSRVTSRYPSDPILILQFVESENRFFLDNELYLYPPEPFKSFLALSSTQKPKCFEMLKRFSDDASFPDKCSVCNYMLSCCK